MFRRLAAAVSAAVLFVLAPAAVAAPPLEAYGKLPALDMVRVSRDGQALAYLKSEGDDRFVVVQKLDGTVVRMADIGRLKVRTLRWADADHVLVIATTTATLPRLLIWQEFPVGYSLNVNTGKVVRLLDKGAQEAYNALLTYPVIGTWQGKTYAFAVGWTLQGEGTADVYRMDLDTGYGWIHQPGSIEMSNFLMTRDGEVVARTMKNQTNTWRLETRSGGGWREVIRSAPGAIETPQLLGFGRTLDTLLVSEDDGGDLSVIREYKRADGSAGEPFGPKVEPETMVRANDGRLVGLGYSQTYPEYEFYEPRLAEIWAKLKASFPNMVVSLASWSDDFGKIVIAVEGSGEPGSWYLIDTQAMKATRVGRERPDISGADVAEVRVVRYRAADGLPIQGFLTLPPGKAPKALPLIVLPHGGPASHDGVEFDWWAQALASRGYAVFQPNFRGSDGAGNKFMRAGYGEWGRKMQTDISDGVAAIAKTGMVDPKRACIVGASYGGYAALAGAALQPGMYRCAAAVAGVSDLPRMLDSERVTSGSARSPTVAYWRRFMGVQSSTDPILTSLSPARQADKVQGPVLLIHGRDDTVVPFEQSVVMERALKAAGKSVTLTTLKNEDHYLSRESTRLQMLQALVAFLEKENPPN